jgi:hypothetical protein
MAPDHGRGRDGSTDYIALRMFCHFSQLSVQRGAVRAAELEIQRRTVRTKTLGDVTVHDCALSVFGGVTMGSISLSVEEFLQSICPRAHWADTPCKELLTSECPGRHNGINGNWAI